MKNKMLKIVFGFIVILSIVINFSSTQNLDSKDTHLITLNTIAIANAETGIDCSMCYFVDYHYCYLKYPYACLGEYL
jgi:hypothetical protein